MWADLDHFSPMSSCSDSKCKKGKIFAQGRTMKFLEDLSPVFDHSGSILLTQLTIPSLDESNVAMIQESRMRLHSEPNVPSDTRSALATTSSDMIGEQIEGQSEQIEGQSGEISRLMQVCPKPPLKDIRVEKGQSGGRGRGHEGRRGGGRGRYWTDLVIKGEEENFASNVVFSEEDRMYLEVLQREQKEVRAGNGVSTSSFVQR
jgi:hypothetical protein